MSVRKSLAWTFLGQLTSLLILFIGSVIVARLLSPHEMGVYGIGLATAGLISIVATFGMSSYLIREVTVSDEQRALAFTMNAIISFGVSAIIFLSSFLAVRQFGSLQVGPVLRLLAIPPLIGIFEFLPSTLLRRDMEFKVTSLVQIGGAVLNSSLTIFLAIRGYSSLSMAYATIAASLFRAVTFLSFRPQHFQAKVSFRGWRPTLVFGLRMITVSGVGQIAQRVSDIVLGTLLGLAALGIYSRASNLATLIFTNLFGTATAVIFSQLSKTFRETGIMRDAFLRGLEIILALMWPLLMGLAILARPVIHLLYGGKWEAAALPLSLLMIAQFVVLSFGMNWELFVLRNQTARQTKYEVARSCCGLLFFSIGCMFGLGGAAIGRLAEAIVGAFIYLPQMPSMAEATRSDFTSIYLKSMSLTVAAVGPSALIMTVNNWSPETPLPMIALGVAVGLGLWLTVLRYLRHPLLNEIRIFLTVFFAP